ncbi:hypothetical protein D3C77_687580 [compost metagenome]
MSIKVVMARPRQGVITRFVTLLGLPPDQGGPFEDCKVVAEAILKEGLLVFFFSVELI